MHYSKIKTHLRAYSIAARRKTTINHAFASAVAPFDKFDNQVVRDAISSLGQDPDGDLRCAYCDSDAETWDHVNGIVKGGKFSGFGHRIGNLLPCCKSCNSAKGNKDWKSYIASVSMSKATREKRISVIQSYLDQYMVSDSLPDGLPEVTELEEIKNQVHSLMSRADKVASDLRTRLSR